MTAAQAPRRASDARTARADLIRGLVAGHEDLYVTSPHFKRAIDTLADLAPAFVEVVRAQAEAAGLAQEALARFREQSAAPRAIPLTLQAYR